MPKTTQPNDDRTAGRTSIRLNNLLARVDRVVDESDRWDSRSDLIREGVRRTVLEEECRLREETELEEGSA